MNPRQSIYRITAAGSIEPFAKVAFLSGGSTLELMDGGKGRAVVTVYEGLPPYMAFASPSGFLGRQVAHEVAAELQVPSNLKDWNDDARGAFLFSRGTNLPGNLVFGDSALQREMDLRTLAPIAVADKLAHYTGMANQLRHAPYESVAGGEQPKFLALVEDAGYVIVKFAKEGSRMADLLPLEHAALRALAAEGIEASRTQVLAGGGYVFLEVQRFDRQGRHGRVGMLSCGAIDDEYFGDRDTWSEFAERCEEHGYLTSAQAREIDVMAAFSELIGNTDRHFENISMLLDEQGEYARVAPAYDILPMRCSSLGAGVDPALNPVAPKVGTIGAKPAVWGRAARAAVAYWTAVERDDVGLPLSEAFRRLAAQNRKEVEAFVQPLLPQG